jgi:hypothetical protein
MPLFFGQKKAFIVIPKIINHQITQIFTRLFIILPKKTFFAFSFSTVFLFFKKKKKCCVNLVKSRGLLIAICYGNDYNLKGENYIISY